MHFLIHAGRIIRKNGPLRNFWTMGFERLNGVIKKPSHIMNNFRNPQVYLFSICPFRISDLSINSIQYRTGTFVLLDLSEQGFLFGEIICSVRDDPKFPFLVVKCYRTDVFDDNSFCHRVIQTVPFETRICALSDLLDYHPLDGLCIDGHINIRMKHFVMKPEETLFPL